MTSKTYLLHRLWHELTDKVQSFFAEPTAKATLPLIFTQFVTLWQRKMNPLVYVKLSIEAARQQSNAQLETCLIPIYRRKRGTCLA
jgi:hypothetical protein